MLNNEWKSDQLFLLVYSIIDFWRYLIKDFKVEVAYQMILYV